MPEDVLDLPALAGDWRGRVGLEVESRGRGRGVVAPGQRDGAVLQTLATWLLLRRAQIEALAGLGARSRVVDRLFRLGLIDRVTVAGVGAYGLSRYAADRMRAAPGRWTALRALKVLAANKLGEVLVRSLGGAWRLEPDAGRTAEWTVAGEPYSVYVYRYWPRCEEEALSVLRAVPGRLLVLVPRRDDVRMLAEALGPAAGAQVRWTWDGAIEPGARVQFWRWVDGDCRPAEQVGRANSGPGSP